MARKIKKVTIRKLAPARINRGPKNPNPNAKPTKTITKRKVKKRVGKKLA